MRDERGNAGARLFVSGDGRLKGCHDSRNGGNGFHGVDGVQAIEIAASYNRHSGANLGLRAVARGVYAA